MKTNLKNLFQKVMEELKDKRTQKIMVWSLGAAICFLILIGIFSAISGKNSSDDVGKSSDEETSTQAQNEEDVNQTNLLDEIFYVDFAQASENIHLATVNGTIDESLLEVHILYDKVDEEVYAYYYTMDEQFVEMVFNYSISLKEGVAYTLAVEENNGVISILQDDVTLCLISLAPNSTCKWSSIIPDCVEYTGEIEGSSASESVTEEGTTDITTTDEGNNIYQPDFGGTEGSSEESAEEETSTEPVVADGDKISYKALFKDVIIAALIAIVLAILVVLAIIAVTRKTNPFKVVAETAKDFYPDLKERRSWKNKKDDFEDDYEEDEYEEDDYEEDDYEVDNDEDDNYEEDEDYEDESDET